MAGIFQGLDAEDYDRSYTDKELVRRIWSYFQKYQSKFNRIVVATILMAALGTALPIILYRAIESAANSKVNGTAKLDPNTMIWLITAVFSAGVLTYLVNWYRRLRSAEMIADVILDMRRDAFTAAAGQDMSFYDEFSSSRILSRITNDTEEFSQIVLLSLDVVNQLTVAVILIALLLTINLPLTLLVLIMAPTVILSALAFRSAARRVTRQSSRVMGEVNRSIQEAVTGISVAKNFRQEGFIYNEFSEVNSQSYTLNVRRALVISAIFPTLNTLAGFATAMLLYFGGRAAIGVAVILPVVSIGAWSLFVSTVDRFWFPMMNAAAFWSQFQQGLSACERVFALIDSDRGIQQTGNETFGKLNGEIKFEDVRFAYKEDEPILPKFNLTIKPGESIALVGHTGAGKSSIIKLISRFYEFQGGSITIDGTDIRQLELESFRRKLGIVSQVPFLFDGTVADNIRYAAPDATDAEIIAMAQKVGEGDWLDTLPEGINSPVGERGSQLSMGQRQMVALMRVLIHNPEIFILDEATASIDPFTESQIQEALDLIIQNTTAIVIAHRLSTIRNVDRIVVLSHGAVIEQGSHDELVAQGGHYAELYDTYFRHQSLEYIEGQAWKG
ncbi:MAG: ATP-binding cassette subfamily B protein [Cellvibrionaceae bacterium]|jgi:ATP-binding cassette subfamily B protein